MLIFSGTNYLGVNQSNIFRKLVERGIDQYGLHYGGSRFSELCPSVFNEAEQLLASITGAEAALIVSSGSKAGILATQLIKNNPTVFAATDVHPALLSSPTKVHFYHSLASTVLDRTAPKGSLVILSNAIDPLHCKPIDFSYIDKLGPEDLLIIDDSHGFGVTGKNGGGIYRGLRARTKARLIVSGSLGKGFGVPGGLILADSETINAIQSLPSFGGGAPPPAAYIYALLNGQDYYDQARKQLQLNINRFQTSLDNLSYFNFLSNYPVFYSKDDELALYLKNKDIQISSFPYPSPESEKITRVVLSSRHSDSEIDLLTDAINAFVSR
jgi:7-keto-8-aminopelargonate synthetase-like enzyme